MTTGYAAATSSTVLEGVGRSWTQNNQAAFAWSQLPIVLCNDKRIGRSNLTTYHVASLLNWMVSSQGGRDWEYGQRLPSSKTLAELDVAFSVRGKAIAQPISRPLMRPGAHRLEDLEVNIVPGTMSELFQIVELAVAAAMVNPTLFTSKTWSGTGTLDTNTAIDHNPLADLTTALLPLRKFQGREGWSLECWGDHRVFDVLSGYQVFTGAGEGSNMASKMEYPKFIERFKSTLRLDRVVEFKTVSNAALPGLTSNLTEIGGGMLWFGIVDRRKSRYDLRTETSTDAPDGSIMLAMSREPEVVSWQEKDTEVEMFDGRAQFTVYNPRYTAESLQLGFFYPSSENLT